MIPTTSLLNGSGPAQDIRTAVTALRSSSDQRVSSLANSANTLQEYIDALKAAVANDLATLNSLITSLTGAVGGIEFLGAGYKEVSGTSFTPDFLAAHTWVMTMTGAATVNQAINGTAGDEMCLVLVQDPTGGWQATLDPSYRTGGTFGQDPTPNSATIYMFRVNGAGNLFLVSPPVTGVTWP